MIPAPNRRWFRWSLRTMFVVVTVACWLGYNLNWIRERDKILAPCREFDWHKKTPRTFNYAVGGNPVGLWIYNADDDQVEMRLIRAPAMLWLFGEIGYCNVEKIFPSRPGQQLTAAEKREIKRVRALFPEALVLGFIDDPPSSDRITPSDQW